MSHDISIAYPYFKTGTIIQAQNVKLFHLPQFLYRKILPLKIITLLLQTKYEYALERMEELLPFVHEDTPLDDRNSIELDIVSDIVEKYEQTYYPVDKPTLGSLMREALFEMGMTAKELAKQVGVSASRISDYINDKSEPSLSTTRRIVNILKLSPEEVLAL